VIRRPLWLGVGVALGVGGTLWAEQRVRRTLRQAAERLTPEHAVGQARARVRAAVSEGRRTRDAREAELWGQLSTREGSPHRRR
jgi:hypothetical protein